MKPQHAKIWRIYILNIINSNPKLIHIRTSTRQISLETGFLLYISIFY